MTQLVETPLSRFLRDSHARIKTDFGGAVADYIPELGKGDPAHFGLSLATLDGHVYACGDTDIPFTIQSISKAFVFAIALERLGPAAVEAAIGVEPSGEAFNSVRLRPDGRPFNAMVNSGAIACAALIRDAEGTSAWDLVATTLSAYAGRTLTLDEPVFRSESETGDRNRAIAYLLRSAGRFRCEVQEAVDVYFRQCSLLVTARDLATMAATLANGGLNPVTGVRVASADTICRTMSVMASAGMYDYAGEWIYRIGLPAKSGVGGGIIAVMPGQVGLGSFSPPLDAQGNSVRGLRACEALSSFYRLHLLNPTQGASRCILASYTGEATASQRERMPQEKQCLAAYRSGVQVLELVGTLTFADVDVVTRHLQQRDTRRHALILDLHRTSGSIHAGAKLLGELLAQEVKGGGIVAVIGLPADVPAPDGLVHFDYLDDATEWVEDDLLRKHESELDLDRTIDLSRQTLLAGLSDREVDALARIGEARIFSTGDTVVSVGGESESIFFLTKGRVGVRLAGGRRVATIAAGSAFGEIALLGQPRFANVVADTAVACLEVSLKHLATLRAEEPGIEPALMRNLGLLLADRLRRTNMKLQSLRG